MSPRQATRYLNWFAEKVEHGDEPTDDEKLMFKEARESSLAVIKKYMRLGPEDWKYTPGEPFK
jgi:hypothetical protein